MNYKTELNENQFEAVTTEAQHVRIIAGAGSGKTRVLTYRISYLISERNVDPNSIVAIAFTNKVAEEMKIRANKPKSSFLSTIYAYVIPIVFLGISVLFTYNKVSVIVPYILTLVIIFGSAIPFIINYKQKIRDDFIDLDMIN